MDELERARRGWQEHLGLIVSGIVGAVIVLRLLGAAEWDGTTAAAILQHAGTANVIFGAVLSYAETFLGIVAWILGAPMFYQWGLRGKWPGLNVTLRAVAALGVALVALSVMLLMMLGIAWLVGVRFGLGDRGVDRKVAADQNHRLAIGAGVGLMLAAFAWNGSVWLPTELIRPEDRAPFTGYVLNEGSDAWVVLRESPRQVTSVPMPANVLRTVCEYPQPAWFSWLSQRPPEFIPGAAASYPSCPEG